MKDEKLQKVLARSGSGSRREMERKIEAGLVSVNGAVAKLGDRVSEGDEIRVEGVPVKAVFPSEASRRVLLYNKPLGEVCTRHDPEGRPTVFDNLPALPSGRWIVIGRLDINTTGLLLFTTDGELANRLMHPSAQIDREYAVRVLGEVAETTLDTLKAGVLLDDGMANFTDVRFFDGDGANRWYHCVVMEGRNREVRRLWESQGVKVSRLKRVRYGPVFLPSDIKVGTWRELSTVEVNVLSEEVGLAPLRPTARTRQQVIDENRAYKRQRSRQAVDKNSATTSANAENKPRRPRGRSVGKRRARRV